MLHCLIINMCWKSFLFSVLSTEGKCSSLLPLENRPTEKARTRLQRSSRREISQPPLSFTSLFLTHSKTTIWYYFIDSVTINRQKSLLLVVWVFVVGFFCCFLVWFWFVGFFFPQKISRKLPLKVELDNFFPPYVLDLGKHWWVHLGICWGSSTNMWAATCSISGPSEVLQEDLGGGTTWGMLELTSPALNLPSSSLPGLADQLNCLCSGILR